MKVLPYVTKGYPGIGGELKRDPKHFQVEEIPLYNPQGSGQHIYVRCVREGMTTRELEKEFRALFDLPGVAIGHGGLKDKHARVTQTISLDLPKADPENVGERIADNLPVKVLEVKRHRNKLAPGHLIGNTFHILLTGVGEDTKVLENARAVTEELLRQGFPNFFGSQRFGKYGDNAERGREILRGKRRVRGKWLQNLLLQSYQSELFNRWLVLRMEQGDYRTILNGEIAKVVETGGLFQVEKVENAQRRFEQHEITYTGPIYGQNLWKAAGAAGELEQQILQEEDLTLQAFNRLNMSGNRRRAVVFPEEIEVIPHPEGLKFTFSLPKGAYATVMMREIMKLNDETRSE